MDLIKKIKELIRKKEKEESIEVPEDWVKDRLVNKPDEALPVLEITVKGKKEEKIKVPWLLKIKRGFCGVMAFITFFMTVAMFNNIPMFIMFAIYEFYLVDYLWKTKQEEQNEPTNL